MKTHIRIATDQFCYAEIEYDREMSADDVVEIYKLHYEAFKQKLSDNLFNDWTDRYLNCERMSSQDLELYEKMSPEQKSHIQWVKRSRKRNEYKLKNNKEIV